MRREEYKKELEQEIDVLQKKIGEQEIHIGELRLQKLLAEIENDADVQRVRMLEVFLNNEFNVPQEASKTTSKRLY